MLPSGCGPPDALHHDRGEVARRGQAGAVQALAARQEDSELGRFRRLSGSEPRPWRSRRASEEHSLRREARSAKGGRIIGGRSGAHAVRVEEEIRGTRRPADVDRPGSAIRDANLAVGSRLRASNKRDREGHRPSIAHLGIVPLVACGRWDGRAEFRAAVGHRHGSTGSDETEGSRHQAGEGAHNLEGTWGAGAA